MKSEHSLNGPSSLRRRELCAGSYRMEKDLPERQSDVADVGNLQHAAAAYLVEHLDQSPIEVAESQKMTSAQYDAVLWAVEQVKSLVWPGCHVVSEHEIDLKFFHPSIEKGTPDVILVQDFVKAIVIDFKFGFKRVQPCNQNLQIACYCAAVKREYDLEDVRGCIVQPALELCEIGQPFDETYLRAVDAAAKSLNPDAPLVAGEEQCQYCRASGRCPVQMEIVKAQGTPPAVTKADVAMLPVETISGFLAAWDDRDIEGIVGAMKQRLFETLMVGAEDANFQLGKGRGSRSWVDNAEAHIGELAKAFDKHTDAFYTAPEMKSVAQIETVIGKSKEARAAIEPLVVKSDGKPKLERKPHA